MGIVVKQSSINTLIIFLAFAIGGINTLFLYTSFLEPKYYGLVVFLLSAANLLMPITAFGVHHTIIKFFSSYQTKQEKDIFLLFVVVLPLFIAIPIGFLGNIFFKEIADFLSVKNSLIKEYAPIIYWVAIATAYFEVFYSWARVQLQSVFGNAVKELYHRISTMILLVLLGLKIIDVNLFIWLIAASYLIRLLLMIWYAFSVYKPKLTFKIPTNYKEVLQFCAYIVLAGSASVILLDIDKVMIPRKEAIELAAYYTVGVFIASVVEAPNRAMTQILQPLTSKAIQENNWTEVKSLYKRSSINLLLICGLFFLLINCNIEEMYKLVPKKEYAKGVQIVLMISIAKLFLTSLGNSTDIISNSKFYKFLLPYGVTMAIAVTLLNNKLITEYGMNGAALATLIVVLLFNICKLFYVKYRFNMQPFSFKSFQLLLVLIAFFIGFYYWDFPFHPIINIGLKTILISFMYLFLVVKMKISNEVNSILMKYLKSYK